MPGTILLDALAQVVLTEGGDRRQWTLTSSDNTISESVEHHFELATNTQSDLPLGGLAGDTGKKFLILESSKPIQLRYDATGSSTMLWGTPIPENGFLCAFITATTHIYLKNFSTATEDPADVRIKLFLLE